MSEIERKRSRGAATGNPFDLATDPTVPKLLAAIQASPVAGKLTATDRAVLDFLLAAAYPTLETKTLHTVAISDLMTVLGSKHESTDWIMASFDRLTDMKLRVPVEEKKIVDGKEKTEERIIIANLVNGSIPKRTGVIRYSFYEELRPMLADPAVFARLRLAVIAQFKSKYATPLYEMFEAYVERRLPRWIVSVDDLRTHLCVGDAMPNWADFARRVINPALKEINEVSGLTVEAELKRSGKKVVQVTFLVRKKEAREAFDAELRHKYVREDRKPRKVRDPKTVDLLDGRSDTERGGPPYIKASTFEEARRRNPGFDITNFEREWMEAQAGREAPRDPDKAFLGWLSKRLANERLS